MLAVIIIICVSAQKRLLEAKNVDDVSLDDQSPRTAILIFAA